MKKTTRTKAAAALLTLAMALSLTACGHEHTWTQATCTAPKTCSECGETEGEALGHSWQDATCAAPKTCTVCKQTEGEALSHTWEEATCTAPKTCTVCGETEGEPLSHTWEEATCAAPKTCTVCGETEGEPHTWREANFQSPQTCTVCGETKGNVLTPDFVTHNIQLMELGETREIMAYDTDKNKTAVAHVTVTDYKIYESNYVFPAKEGYEYREAAFRISCDDVSALEYGTEGWSTCNEDYYDIELHDDFAEYNYDEGIRTYKLNFNGEEMDGYGIVNNTVLDTPKGNTSDVYAYFVVQVPVGYDGFVFGIFYGTIGWPENGYIYDIYDPDAFALFRLA